MTKRKKRLKKEKKIRKTKKIVKGILNDLITQVEEHVNEEDYFNIFYLSQSEVPYLISINSNNVQLLNKLHAEKMKHVNIYNKLYIRKNKIPDLTSWLIVYHDEKYFLVSKYVINDIQSNLSKDIPNEIIARTYIENNSNLIETILFMIDPKFIEPKQENFTEEQKKAKEIREFLNSKNELFNYRMKVNSIKNNNNKIQMI